MSLSPSKSLSSIGGFISILHPSWHHCPVIQGGRNSGLAPHLSLSLSPVLTRQAIQFYILNLPQICSPLSISPATFQALSLLTVSVSVSLCLSTSSLSPASPPRRPPDPAQPSSIPAIGGNFLKCKSDPVIGLQGAPHYPQDKAQAPNVPSKAPRDWAPPALVSPPIYPYPTRHVPATWSLYYTSHFPGLMPLPLLSPWLTLMLYLQLKHHLLQEVLPDSHPLQVGEVSLCSGLS